MSNLVPELRADKDGKLVTRHVRVDATNAATKSFPAPATVTTPVASEDFLKVESALVHVLADYLRQASPDDDLYLSLDDEDGDDSWIMKDEEDPEGLGWDPNAMLLPESIGPALAELPERTIRHMRAMIDANPYRDDYAIALLHALTYETNNPQLIEYMTYLYDDLSGLFPDRDVFGDNDVNTYTLARDYIQAFHNYESVGYKLPEDIYDATEEEHVLMDALHYLNTELGEDGNSAEPELGKIVMEQPELVQDVIDLVGERGTQDADVIREVLSSRTPSIRSGIL